MKALVLHDIGKLEYTDVSKPEPQKGEALIKVMATGICGSDIPRAYRDGAHKMPLIIGHEFAGIVEAVGEGVSSDLAGRRVGVFPLIPCRKCGPCRNGQYEMCRNYDYLGSRSNGGFAEYVTVPEENLIDLPDSVSYEAAAMLEPMAVAVHAIRQCNCLMLPAESMGRTPGSSEGVERTDSCKNKSVAVIGLGTIGTLLVQFLLEAGCKDLLVIGNKEFQKKTMMDLGVAGDRFCDFRNDDVGEFIMDHTGGNGADAFFECVGSSVCASVAVDCTAPAGDVCFVGNPHSDMTFEKKIYWKILRNQLNIHGTWNSSFLGREDGADDDWHYVLERLDEGSINPEKLITHRFPPEEIIRGFELMRDRTEEYIKVMSVTPTT